MKKSEKPFFVENLTEEIKSASSVILLNYEGLNVSLQQELKKSLREINAKMFVTKNTLFKLAAESAKVDSGALSDTVLTGPTAFVITEDDPIAPLQILHKFAADNNVPQFKVGLIEGIFQDKETLEKLAQLPGKDILYAQTVAAIAGPMYGIVGTLQANLQKLVYILNAKAKS